MKTYFLLISALIIGLSSCDQIEEGNFIDGDGPSTTEGVLRKVLIEDFTGHKCQNCPKAAEELHAIQAAFPEQVVGIAIHAGYFAGPNSAVAPYLTTDFRTEEGTEIHDFFGPEAYPVGMVDRNAYPNVLLNYQDWSSVVVAHSGMESAELKIDISHNRTEDFLTIDVTVTGVKTCAGEHKLVVCITEDNIVDWQTVEGEGNVEDYEHNHVLRKVVDGTWGQEIGSISVDQDIVGKFSCTLDAAWVFENCNIVAYVYHPMDYQVVQVEEAHIN
jgi:hypothetical protein